MANIVIEMFLGEYFLFQAILGKFLGAGKNFFIALGKTFLLSDDKLEELYILAENRTVQDITSEKDFKQFMRINKYSQLAGINLKHSRECVEVVEVKGVALSVAENLHLKPETQASRNAVYAALTMAADAGSVHALRIMGILLCEGIFLDKNLSAGIQKLEKTADWNDKVSLLALLRYSDKNRRYNISRLYTMVKDTPYSSLYEAAATHYQTEGSIEIKQIQILEKAFNSSVLKREQLEPRYARVLTASAIKTKDKAKAVLTESKELISIIADLPVKLSPEISARPDLSALGMLPLVRKEEQSKIERSIGNSDVRKSNTYRPLCICSDSSFLLNMYAEAISGIRGKIHFERIDVADLTAHDFEPSPNNIFVRCVNEDKDNCFLIFFKGNTDRVALDAVKNFLQSGKRAKFHLASPNITLDLGSVLPVCFCDRDNLEYLSPYCDVLCIADVKDEELKPAVGSMLAGKSMLYGMENIELAKDAYELLYGRDVDGIEQVLDRAIRAYRVKDGKIVLTRDMLEGYLTENKFTRMGFGIGGGENEN